MQMHLIVGKTIEVSFTSFNQDYNGKHFILFSIFFFFANCKHVALEENPTKHEQIKEKFCAPQPLFVFANRKSIHTLAY